jgi:hypothetical protein
MALTDNEKIMAEIIAMHIIRERQLTKAFCMLEKAYMQNSDLNDDEQLFIDEIRATIEDE